MTFRNWRATLFWSWAAVTFCALCYVFDKWGFDLTFSTRRDIDHRMFKNPTELPMRIFGLPHFIVALMFVLSSRRMKQARSIAYFLGLLAIGTVFCIVFYKLGAHSNAFLMFLFYFYFLIHGFRDDAYFYKAYGDMPPDEAKTHAKIMAVIQCLAIGLLLSLIWPTYAQMSLVKPRLADPILQNFFPSNWPFIVKLSSTFVPMVLIAIFAMWRIARIFPNGLAGLWQAHRPILSIQLASLGIVLLALVGGPWTFNIVVLMHFVGWYLFAVYLLGKNPAKEPPKGLWPWMRTTRKGFMTLHLGLAALVTLLVAVDVYGFGKDCWLDVVIGSKNFYYWTIMHVTLSFLPR